MHTHGQRYGMKKIQRKGTHRLLRRASHDARESWDTLRVLVKLLVELGSCLRLCASQKRVLGVRAGKKHAHRLQLNGIIGSELHEEGMQILDEVRLLRHDQSVSLGN